MQAFLWAIVGNTLFAALLAVMVWLASRFLHRRPALIHALWILVLLKLVTPPLFDASEYITASAAPPKSSVKQRAVENHSQIHIEENIPESIAIMEEQLRRAQEAKTAHAMRPWWPTLLFAVWVLGSVAFFSLSLYRALRFSWMLHGAGLADLKLVEIAQAQADRLDLRRLPTIKVVTACISPLVWQTPTGTTIVLPQKLVGELGPDQLRLLLAHELAHVKRGDPLVRWFALGVLTLHWWNPIVWLAVRQIEAAQEACCDSLVLSASGASPKRYAEMLLHTVDFLAGQETPPPALAAGFTSGSSLKGRCEMILSKRTPFALARTTRWTLALLGLAILPLSTPLLGQEEKKPSGDELAARVERIEKALEELKSLLSNRASEEKEVRARLEAANAELAAKMKERQAEDTKPRERIDVARAHAEAERAAAHKELAHAREGAAKKSAEEAERMQKEIQEKVQAELAKVQEEVARATKHSADAAGKLAQDLAKSHGEDAAKYAEKLSADIANKIKDQVALAEKIAREHAEHAEKFTKEHAKKFEEHAKHAEKYAEEHAKHAEKFAEEHAKHFQEHAEKFAKEAEKHAKQAMEHELPKLKEHMAKMKDQMKLEAEKMAKAAEELSKNPEMKKEYEAIKEKMNALKDQWKEKEEKELSKMKSMLREYRLKEDGSPANKLKEKRVEEKTKEERVKEDAKGNERRELEQQLREREERIRALQKEVEKLRKELGGADRQPRRDRVKRSEEVAEIPVLNKVPYLSRLFRNKNRDEVASEIAEAIDVQAIEMDLEALEDIDVNVDALDMEIEEPAEAEEALSERIDQLLERKFHNQNQDAPSAVEVLKRASKQSADAPVKP